MYIRTFGDSADMQKCSEKRWSDYNGLWWASPKTYNMR